MPGAGAAVLIGTATALAGAAAVGCAAAAEGAAESGGGAGGGGLAPGITTFAACADAAHNTRAERLRAILVIESSIRIHEGLRGRGAFLPLEQRAVAARFERGLGESPGARLELERLVVVQVLAARPQLPDFLVAVADQHVSAVDLEDFDPVGLGFLRLDGTEVEALASG